jgi:hypothetical protein
LSAFACRLVRTQFICAAYSRHIAAPAATELGGGAAVGVAVWVVKGIALIIKKRTRTTVLKCTLEKKILRVDIVPNKRNVTVSVTLKILT